MTTAVTERQKGAARLIAVGAPFGVLDVVGLDRDIDSDRLL